MRHLPKGGIVSGGMDSKLCLWGRAGTACKDLAGHSASISALEVLQQPGGHSAAGAAGGGRFLSASYDKTVCLWDAAGGRPLQRLAGHAAPVMQLCARAGGDLAASGDRCGGLVVWDLAAGRAQRSVPAAYEGHITALAWDPATDASDAGSGGSSLAGPSGAGTLYSGGQDGWLRAWDGQAPGPALGVGVHAGRAGRGAVGGILPPAAASSLVVTAGADGSVRGLDTRRGLQQAWAVQLRDFPYSLVGAGEGVLAGCGDGSLWAIERGTGRVLYALGASAAAVRNIHTRGRQLVAGGDDGVAMLYEAPADPSN